MKTLILNGSPRKNGDTAYLIKQLAARLDGECKIVNCYYDNISPCIDCRYCKAHEGCSVDDDMTAVYEYLTDCDNVVIASPIYFSELTGRMLDVCSRLQTYFCAAHFRKETVTLKKKKGAVILTGGGSGNPHKPYSTAVCLLHHMNAKEICPLVCSFDTDNVPAAEDKNAVKGINDIADFFNA